MPQCKKIRIINFTAFDDLQQVLISYKNDIQQHQFGIQSDNTPFCDVQFYYSGQLKAFATSQQIFDFYPIIFKNEVLPYKLYPLYTTCQIKRLEFKLVFPSITCIRQVSKSAYIVELTNCEDANIIAQNSFGKFRPADFIYTYKFVDSFSWNSIILEKRGLCIKGLTFDRLYQVLGSRNISEIYFYKIIQDGDLDNLQQCLLNSYQNINEVEIIILDNPLKELLQKEQIQLDKDKILNYETFSIITGFNKEICLFNFSDFTMLQ